MQWRASPVGLPVDPPHGHSVWTCHVGPQMDVLLLNGLVCSPVQTEKQSGLGSVLGGVGGGRGLPSPLDLGRRAAAAERSGCQPVFDRG